MSTIPKTSKAAVLVNFNEPLQIQEIPIPEIGPGAILVKVEMAGICGSDVHIQQGQLGLGKHDPPLLPGHEVIGKIIKLGDGRTHDISGECLHVGDRIMWSQTSCNECYYCGVLNEPLLCSDREYYGFYHPHDLKGGFSEYEYIDAKTTVVKIPDELSNEETIGVACGFRSVVAGFEKLDDAPLQANYVIQGAGPLGLYSTVLARESRANKIIVIDGSEERLALARKWGADHTINLSEIPDPTERLAEIMRLTNNRGPEIVIECTGHAPAVNEGLEIVQVGGKYLILGVISKDKIELAPSKILGKKLTIIGSQSALIGHYYKALQFIKEHKHKYPFDQIITKKYSLEEINEALEDMKLGKVIKPVIDNQNRM